MTHLLKKAGLALAMSATALTVAAPAEAQYYGRQRHHDNTGTAIIAGIAGLAIGAVIASSNNNDQYRRRGYSQRGYIQGGTYGDGYGYNDGRYNDYRRSYDNRGQGYGGAYDQNAYGGGYYDQNAYDRCRVENRYDRYSRRTVVVRVCN
ncbi:hypothetical protein [Sphingomonas oligophenolica]|uniref:17 kDa surface antigen n=1 Tax=Sphingomonas oligophenolica TaxID=301154 RepID=A0A502CUT9_9SPHN|nr:hypothetical protein [Sphingomonas oligophenolica]TPG15586.1 hypothetical protein EAH84_01985 [Sphingomonas oligophenolica]